VTTTDEEHQLEQIADELYAARPDEFAALRDEYIKKAKAEKKTDLARELGKLRRPTLSAWLINLLWRDQREVMEQLFDLSQEMGRAQAEAAGPEMRSLMTQRRQVEQALLRQAKALARERGVDVTDSIEREAQETLGAALAQPAVAEEVRSGRLVKSASYAGFGGGAPATPAAGAPRPAPAPAAREPADIRAAQRARERREAAERRVAEAREAVDAAASALTNEERALAFVQRQQQQRKTQVDTLEAQLRDLEEEVAQARNELTTAEQAARSATRNRDQATKAHAQAVRSLEQAQQELAQLRSARSSD